MAKKISEVVKCSLARIETCKLRIIALHFACSKIRQQSRRGGDSDQVSSEFSALHSALFSDLNDAYRDLFMWSALAPEEAQTEARKQALQHYLSEGTTIMHYLQIDGIDPVGWLESDAQEFRDEIAALREHGHVA